MRVRSWPLAIVLTQMALVSCSSKKSDKPSKGASAVTSVLGDQGGTLQVTKGELNGTVAVFPPGALPAGAKVTLAKATKPPEFALAEAVEASVPIALTAKNSSGEALWETNEPIRFSLPLSLSLSLQLGVESTKSNLCVLGTSNGKKLLWRGTSLEIAGSSVSFSTKYLGVFQAVLCGQGAVPGFTPMAPSISSDPRFADFLNGIPVIDAQQIYAGARLKKEEKTVSTSGMGYDEEPYTETYEYGDPAWPSRWTKKTYTQQGSEGTPTLTTRKFDANGRVVENVEGDYRSTTSYRDNTCLPVEKASYHGDILSNKTTYVYNDADLTVEETRHNFGTETPTQEKTTKRVLDKAYSFPYESHSFNGSGTEQSTQEARFENGKFTGWTVKIGSDVFQTCTAITGGVVTCEKSSPPESAPSAPKKTEKLQFLYVKGLNGCDYITHDIVEKIEGEVHSETYSWASTFKILFNPNWMRASSTNVSAETQSGTTSEWTRLTEWTYDSSGWKIQLEVTYKLQGQYKVETTRTVFTYE